ncbi:MAG: topoisomerase DNA-binding C4 zinc finger domain-containing protein, partial [Clostridia bacterium]|nr:topoisomerase DNA-binding C4 zinc finger domain-containing protein [Clostridia bacterium]
QETREKLEQNICPRCGKPLVLRNGSYGEFYGCTGYPKCRFTKNIR